MNNSETTKFCEMSKCGNLDVYDNCKSLYGALKTGLDFPMGPKYLEMTDFG